MTSSISLDINSTCCCFLRSQVVSGRRSASRPIYSSANSWRRSIYPRSRWKISLNSSTNIYFCQITARVANSRRSSSVLVILIQRTQHRRGRSKWWSSKILRALSRLFHCWRRKVSSIMWNPPPARQAFSDRTGVVCKSSSVVLKEFAFVTRRFSF